MNLPVMRSASKLNGIAFCIMLGAMFLYSLPTLYGFARSQENPGSLFFDGKLVRHFEQFYDKQLFLRDPSIKLWANAQQLIFGEATSGAVLGRDGWLFTSQEYRVPNNLEASIARQVSHITQARDQLQAEGMRLVLLPVPMKLEVYADYRLRQPAETVETLYQRLQAELQAQAVEVVDLRDGFRAAASSQELFLSNDTHWSPAGARLAAELLVARHPELRGPTRFVTEQIGSKQHSGDLQRYLQFDQRLRPDYFEPVELALYETRRQEQQVDAHSLFGDIGLSTAVVGTSYTQVAEWNFIGALKQALGQDVMSVAVEAHGPFHAMDNFLKLEPEQRHGIETVIWEFPVRTLLAQQNTRRASLDPFERQF
ncbi:hypothetical protein ACFSB1_04490 [Halopseudomonas phragmitis]|uniref:AlgX/AlgJ SGNH hydrolase-like domain-containing protein n=1 Tax=Halopseudomonas phragmitis TaxID=1931241 RepID=A0A1V0B340_9GAMM|nr:hypothetical protein [Halopseudomonas phragmitis]AQZ94194.1 hypothetical protein BVH74_05245 [Halopseudomonas phragmitis]